MQQEIPHLYPPLDDSHPLAISAKSKGLSVRVSAHSLDISRDTRVVRISLKHLIYAPDIINSFDYYFGAVESQHFDNRHLVDYSSPRYHNVIGFELMPVLFSSFCEPIMTTNQYLDFANLEPGLTVLDLGAYSGLTSIVFKEIVGRLGRVISVDADLQNINTIRANLNLYKKITGNGIDILYGAVWNHTGGLSFSMEGNMGSSASDIVGIHRGSIAKVKSFTLSELCRIGGIDSVDFIKCDVEGAESVIFEDEEFFRRWQPRIIVEPHYKDGIETTDKCISDLERFGYTFKKIIQTGVVLPLLECYPPQR